MTQTVTGGCHCGSVRFRATCASRPVITLCNCSICCKTGYQHLIVPAADFRLESGQEELTTYSFNTGVAQHYFCKICGVKSFYRPRSHPDGISINTRCLDKPLHSAVMQEFDGRNWESARQNLADHQQ